MTSKPHDLTNNKDLNHIFQNGENINGVPCKIKGSIPSWLSGSLIRNGPGEFTVGEDSFKHWFDGHALIHKFEIENGEVIYTSKFTQSKDYQINHQCNKVVIGTFGTACYPDPCKNIFSRFFSKFISRKPSIENSNVNMTKLGETYYAITDAPFMHIIDSKSLDSEKFLDLSSKYDVKTFTAHPHFDLNGDFYNLGVHMGPNGFYGVYKVSSDSMSHDNPMQHLKIHAEVPMQNYLKPCYFHSFGLSENYIVLHEQPVRFNVLKLLQTTYTWDSVMTTFEHLSDEESVYHVVYKSKPEEVPTKYCSKGRFCFHHINSYEQTVNGKKFLVVDMLCADGPTFFYFQGCGVVGEMNRLHSPVYNFESSFTWMDMIKGDDSEGQDRPRMQPYRFVLPLDIDDSTKTDENLSLIENCSATAVLRADGSVFLTPEMLLDEEFEKKYNCWSVELPTINYKEFNTKPYTYMYCTGEEKGAWFSQLLKIDVHTKQSWQWKEENHYPSEAIFVKDPSSSDEDGGVLLSTVISHDPSDPIFLLVLDAKTFTEVARAEINAKLSYPLHGCFSSL